MNEVTLKQLLEAGCHFGHKADRWHPKADAFIYQTREGIHIIDLVKTKAGLDAAVEFVYNTAKSGGKVLFVGTKRQAAAVVKEQATAAGAPYISQRWIGGFLTNWEQVHRNLEKIRRLTDEEQKGAWKKYPKHERMKLSRYLGRLNYFYGGVVALMSPPNAVFIVDIKREDVAVHEAKRMGTPVVAVVDTNSNPIDVTYTIPANDDAVGSVRLIVETLAQAYKEGRERYEKQKVEMEDKAEKTEKAVKGEEKKVEGKKVVSSQSSDSRKDDKEIKEKAEEVKEDEKPKKKRGRPKKLKI